MTAQAAAKSRRRTVKPIYMVCRKLVNPETGEFVGALVPSSAVDSRLLRQKKVGLGKEFRVEIKKPRSARFHRLVHVLGMLMVDQVEAFTGVSSHEAIKRLQRETGICCEQQDIEVPGFGKLVVNVAQSLAFDEMDETEFRRLFKGICRHVAEKYWPGLTEEQIEAQAGVMTE